MKTIIETLWESLESGAKPSSGIVIRRFPADFLPEISATIHLPMGYPGFGIKLSEISLADKFVGQNFRDLNVSSPASDPTLLLIELRNPALREIFAVLCDDLANYLKSETTPSEIIHELGNRLRQWSLLFEKSAATGLSPEEQRGLFGELVFLKVLLEKSSYPLLVLNGWLGPSGRAQDFFYDDQAVEIKTTIGNNHQTLTISNAIQLDESGLAHLWLVHYALEISVSESALTLNGMIDNLVSLLNKDAEATTRLLAKLAEAGYQAAHSEQYGHHAYLIRDKHFYEVKDEFPRIRNAELRTGIEALKYTIRVADCKPWQVDFSTLAHNLPVFDHDPYL